MFPEKSETYFATSDRNVKSNTFIDVLISRQPIYCVFVSENEK